MAGSPVQDQVHFLQVPKICECITELSLGGREWQVPQEQPACGLLILCIVCNMARSC